MHPSEVLFQGEAIPVQLPVCDHYAGSEKLMRKSLALQQELGPVFDITFDCEDGAAVGLEREHATLCAQLINSPENVHNRVGVRIHDPAHPHWREDIDILVAAAGARLAYVVVPKVTDVVEVARVTDHVNHVARSAGIARHIPIHVLIETHAALEQVFDIAALVQVECLSFGLMDFVSAHHGAIPGDAMRSPGQFEYPLIRRAMLEISAACHRHGKVPSHNVSTDVQHPQRAGDDASRARAEFGYLRKWSIHPGQIAPIVAAFRPTDTEIGAASEILLAAHENNWAPIRHDGQLHDRASYRYYWALLQRAHATGTSLPAAAAELFFD
ncbi:L-malyl-CoA/beta-methylmalyl-CoA lyase [Cupriavidus campinensis]|uniref:Aldolase/citrate lyase family protein n=1 Tax=Cupriavidus campinensis TaxID=151783 RepID=A0AAE9L1D1_9BURK|nr:MULTISPECIES: aldolase/citrate lyase family protein [Cupriavidus]URF03194.1 aldolase/citrate lyase family protein [Cupriavidus campinensis]CAG2154653.1 L-malyl-CoA/beta-methylmalyl-CoA lyase [Cupriavidus campinensis]